MRVTRGFLTLAVLTALSVAAAAGVTSSAVDRGHPPGWRAIADAIRAAEYELRPVDRTGGSVPEAAWQAPNRAQQLRLYFAPRGVTIVPRRAGAGWESVRIAVAGWQRAETGWRAGPAPLEPDAHRARYRRERFEELWTNAHGGVELRLTCPRPPVPRAAEARGETRAPLLFGLALDGSLSARRRGAAIQLVDPGGRAALRVALGEVRDARGMAVVSRLEPLREGTVGRLRVRIDDGAASYPLTVAIVIRAADWILDGGQDGALLGVVSTAGDVDGDGRSDLVVGAPGYDTGAADAGRVFVFYGAAEGPANVADWTADGELAGAAFGAAVSTAGDVNGDGFADLVVGAPGDDQHGVDAGRAYLYRGSAAGLSALPVWSVGGDRPAARFGAAVGTAGDVDGDGYGDLVVGAPERSETGSAEGAAFVFLGSAAGPSTTADATVMAERAGARFGATVGAAGDVDADGRSEWIVGAPGDDDGRGAVRVYAGLRRSASWTATGSAPGDRFGEAAATAGDVNGDGFADLIVGAPGAGSSGAGEVKVFLGSAQGLAPEAAWQVAGDRSGAAFGAAAGLAGDVNGDGYADVVIGAPDAGEGGGPGRAFVYLGSAPGLALEPWWTLEGPQAGSRLGASAFTAGDVDGDGWADVVVGAPDADGRGRAIVVTGSSRGPESIAGWTADGDQPDGNYAHSVASAGDVNGDGYADVIVGADFFDTGAEDAGRAFVFHGSPAGLETVPAWTADGDQAGANFGHVVASAGDVNGDGYSDVIVSAYRYDHGEVDEGRAYVFHGSPSGLVSEPAWTAEGDQPGALFGSRLSGAGDVNGDGFADVVVGAISYDSTQPDEGGAFVYHGSPAGLSSSPDWSAEGQQLGAGFGVDVAAAGDVNGDGYGDVIVGAFTHDNGQPDEGRAYVFHGSAAGLSTVANWSAESNQTAALFGHSVASAGDVDGDGFADVVVGALWFDHGERDEGAAFVFHGSSSGLALEPAWIAEGDQVEAEFGFPVAPAGDLNGDGFADLIVGAYRFDHPETDEGRAHVYLGSATGLAAEPAWTAESDQPFAEFGFIVDTAGDVNGDGYADVLVGAHTYDGAATRGGRAWLYYGNGGAGRAVTARQRRADDLAPLDRLAVTDDPQRFGLRALGHNPFGRSAVRLEWQVAPLGALFDGESETNGSAWIDSGGTGAELQALVAGLPPGTPLHWRARVRFDTTRAPWQPASRWLTPPWNGQQETDLRTRGVAPAGRVPDGGALPGTPLRVEPGSTSGWLELSWGASCLAGDADYEVYSGILGRFGEHRPERCTTGGATHVAFPAGEGSRYFLVVPHNGEAEGSYGTDAGGRPRPQGTPACRPRSVAACE